MYSLFFSSDPSSAVEVWLAPAAMDAWLVPAAPAPASLGFDEADEEEDGSSTVFTDVSCAV